MYIVIAFGALVVLTIVVVLGVIWRRRNKTGGKDDENLENAGDAQTVSTFTKKFDTSKPKGTKKMKLKLIIKLDSGGFGEVCVIFSTNDVKVWKGRYMDEPVAVKMILKTKISDANKFRLVKMMNDEAELMHKLKHPRIGTPTSFANYSSVYHSGYIYLFNDSRVYARGIIDFAHQNSKKQILVGRPFADHA
jgi:hypothetical protein